GSWWLRRDPYCDERVKREESADEDFGGSARCESDVDAGATAEASDVSSRMDRAFLALPDLECVVVCEADEFVPRLEHAERSLLGLIHRGNDLRLRTCGGDRYVEGPIECHGPHISGRNSAVGVPGLEPGTSASRTL